MSDRIEADGGVEEKGSGLEQCEQCPRWKEVRQRMRISKVLSTAIEKLEERFGAQDFKPTVGDYLKLVEMEEELEQVSQTAKEIKATWVDPTTSCSER